MPAMQKGLVMLGLVLTISFLKVPQKALAHFLATDGSITTIMHIEPDDSPTAGKPTSIDFIFKDSTDKFHLTDCSCSLSVSQQGKQLLYAPIIATQFDEPTVYAGGAPYNFPAAGSYHIALSGRPTEIGDFRPFNLSWDIKVSKPVSPERSFSVGSFAAFFLLILVMLLAIGCVLYFVG